MKFLVLFLIFLSCGTNKNTPRIRKDIDVSTISKNSPVYHHLINTPFYYSKSTIKNDTIIVRNK